MVFIQGFNRNQLQMMSFDEFVKQDCWARVVDLFVEVLPLKELGWLTNKSSNQLNHPFNHSLIFALKQSLIKAFTH